MKTRFGQFTVDSETRQLSRGDEEIHLSPKAFDLLRTLLLRRPGVVTKHDLFSLIWPNTFVSEANLNVVVGEVRRALGDDARVPRFIRTVHGVGYAFCADATDGDAGEGHAAHSARYWLEIKDRIYPLEAGDHTIGRDPGCDVWLNDAGVSRRHARILVAAGSAAVMLEDLGSTNGTFIGRRRIGTPTPLSAGDHVKVGSVELTFREGADRLAATRRVRRG